jgi:hypothetical protein
MTDKRKRGWKIDTKNIPLIVGTQENPTKFESGQVIINKKATKKNLKKLVEINNDGVSKKPKAKITTDATDGGLLKGKPHYDKFGNATGGIPGLVDNTKPIETEGEEFVLSKEASEKHWKELSAINTSTGGVPINPPNYVDENPETYAEGGKVIEFNPNHVPSKRIINYANNIRKKHPEIWKLGGNIFGNQAFKNLFAVSKRGYWLDSEEWMYIKWRSYVARHIYDFRIEGVVAMLKWADTVEKGWAYMKDLIEQEIEKRESKKMDDGGLTNSDKSNIFINGEELNISEAINLIKNDISELEKKEITLQVDKQIKSLYKTLEIFQLKQKINSIFNQQLKVRNNIEYEKLEKELIKLKKELNQKQNNNDLKNNYGLGGVVTFKDKYNKKYGYKKDESHNLEQIAKDTGISLNGLQQIYNKGIGAYKTNPESVRPNVKSKEQWAMARVYSAVMGGDAAIVDKNELKMVDGGNVNKANCIDYIKNSESIKNNGYYLHFENLNNYVSSNTINFPKVQSLCLITFNSGGQKNLKAIDTINSVELANKLAKLLNIELGIARIIVSEQAIHSKRFTMDMLDKIENNNIIVADRDTIVCENISDKFEQGGIIPASGMLTTKDKKNKLDYKKVGNDYEFVVYDGEANPVENYKRVQYKKRDKNKVLMNYNQFVNYLYSEGYIDDKMAQGGLIAPNGKPSNLTREQYKLVRTPEFKAWFGDWENEPANASKVVDENSEPLVVYHGTSQYGFTTFDKNLQGQTDKGDYGKGFYFTPIKESAALYTTTQELIRQGYNGNFNKIYSVFLNIRNPLLQKSSSHIESVDKNFDGVLVYNDSYQLRFGNVKNLSELVAFESNQIKLADGTNTTFDGNNSDIRFEDGGNTNNVELVSVDYLDSIRTQEKSNWNYDLEKSIEKEGIKEPVIIGYWEEYGYVALMDGHHRLDTAIDLGIEKIPAIIDIRHDEPEGKIKVYSVPKYSISPKKPSDLGIYDNGGNTKNEIMNKNSEEIAQIKLEILRLQTKAFKMMPQSPKQKEVIKQIDTLYSKLESLGGKFEEGGSTDANYTNTEKLISEIKKNANVEYGVISTTADGEKYRYVRYRYKNPVSPNWLVMLFDKAAAENGSRYRSQFSYGDSSFFYDRPVMKNLPNGQIGFKELEILNEFANGGSTDAKDTITVDIPLLIRMFELSREDIHSDAELHQVVERLLDLKNKPVLTMDDYAYIADIEHKHINKMALGGTMESDPQKLISQAHYNLTVRRGRKEYAPSAFEIQEEIDRMVMERQFGSNNI